MKVLITCGPSYEPIDDVRRITNFSTGELGTLLAESLAQAGLEVVCLRGVAATYPAPPAAAALRSFATNDDLAAMLAQISKEGPVRAILHAAALCDYRVKRIGDANGRRLTGAKIASRGGPIALQLEPATKLISNLREWFPSSLIVGWKYELEGDSSDAVAKARRQIAENHTDACVVNGRAYGEGFGFVQRSGYVSHVLNKQRLCDFLCTWLRLPRARRHRMRAAHSVASGLVPAAANESFIQCKETIWSATNLA